MDESISEMDVVFARKEATLDPEIVRDAARRTRQRLMKRKLKLVTSQEGCLYVVDIDTKSLVDLENIHVNLKDIDRALTLSNGCSLDEADDCCRVLQTILDIVSKKQDTTGV